MSPGYNRSQVVACAAYAKGCRVADVALEDISEVLKQDDRFVWIGLYEPDEALLKEV
jgi:magnesium transporter